MICMAACSRTIPGFARARWQAGSCDYSDVWSGCRRSRPQLAAPFPAAQPSCRLCHEYIVTSPCRRLLFRHARHQGPRGGLRPRSAHVVGRAGDARRRRRPRRRRRCTADVAARAHLRAGGHDARRSAAAGRPRRGRHAGGGRGGRGWCATPTRAARLRGVLGLGGSAGTTIGTAAMRALPLGVPKLMVSTLASGQVRQYVGDKDILMLNSVVDIAGHQPHQPRGADAGGARRWPAWSQLPARSTADRPTDKPLVAATMFGVTTPCVERAREMLEAAGYEVLVFHATGNGGAGDGIADRRRPDRRRARHHDDRAGRRAGRRRAHGRPRPADRGRRARRAAGRLGRRARHGQLPRAGDRAARSSRTASSTGTTPT